MHQAVKVIRFFRAVYSIWAVTVKILFKSYKIECKERSPFPDNTNSIDYVFT